MTEELDKFFQTINNNEKTDKLFVEGYIHFYYNVCYSFV